LAAIGTIGELWLEGPIVGAGYLNNPKTASAFVEDPIWLLNGIPGRVPGRRERLYRTGDLVYYNPDGSLGFVRRNDTQVKINGQRMELGEVEYHVRQLLSTKAVPQSVVDVIIPNATRSQTLAVFLVMPNDDSARVS
jgi:non-ribosomal peptide synthetase component F